MKKGYASRTAEYMALFRALESSRPSGVRLFDDPFAGASLSPLLHVVAWAARCPGIGNVVPRVIDARWPGARSSAVARTRFIDDVLHAEMKEGVQQIVLLGAGFDSRAYRLPGIQRTRVFEVDHPATLARKRRALARALSALPGHVRFVATDFNQRRLQDAMAGAGYDESVLTFFVWEGVTNYLTEAAVDATLRWCSRAAVGSKLVFTYVHRAVLDDPASFVGTEKLFATLAAAGEKWTFGLDPSGLAQFLSERGLGLEQDVGASEYRALYFGNAASQMRGYEFYRIALARAAGAANR